MSAELDIFATAFADVVTNVERVIRGKREAIELAVICLFAEGHLLVEDVPGLGKTTLARSLAASVNATSHRIQFTPDLLPSDITGTTVYNQRLGEFGFRPGPVFANLVIGDEINRASPKTQSALLEVMEERYVTVDGTRYPVPLPFMVVATQNPVDMDGTYALPEAQVDRFLMRLRLGYPSIEAELEILESRQVGRRVEDLSPVMRAEDVVAHSERTLSVHVAPALRRYIVDLVASTRRIPDVLRLGGSPRGSIALLRAVQVRAASTGREFATPDDVKALAAPVLAHRLVLSPETELKRVTAEDVLAEVLRAVPSPRRLIGV
ncbi:MoxR family ATPase [Frankia sp. AgB1.9]|uniref:AAA family ATPase n=1 Tax=unclassified Frankia TaxID=2632575 RepID=UPI0019333D51|nr:MULTISPECIES: MoxR family ATPase [unclassified Frankia]MBL7486742.1 MoxR family ATPase [Frankia sp. AgW1.1]MBL7552070.1 MoxR family ATPase [Frankia sp. AgB1.9]MBL7618338.1 MoxR family ATPase [Frankia sp. AgB1.8]